MARPRYVRYRTFNRLQHSTQFLKWLDEQADRLETTAKFVFKVLLVDHKMTFEQVQQIEAVAAPTNTALPVVMGDAIVGEVLYAEPGTWEGFPLPVLAYQWFRDAGTAEEIEGATASAYTLEAEDVGATVFVRVTATNELGTLDKDSAPTDVVIVHAAPTNSVAPTITGDETVNSILTVTPGDWDGYPVPVLSYQWFRTDGDNPVEIEGATDETYTITEEDVGFQLFVTETATNSEGTASASSTPTATIEGDE